jgi:LmbE family N-acetylglucosaminyl deacetylase
MARILGVFAHPDDESFGFAGTAMKLLARGHRVGLVTLTRGGAGRWYGIRPLYSWDPRALAQERAKEWRGAVATIGLSRAWLLHWPDQGVATAPITRITRQLAAIYREFKPDAVITFGPEGAGSEHDDHAATSRHASRAFRWSADASVRIGGLHSHVSRWLLYTTAPEGTPGMRGRRPAGHLSPTHVVDIRRYLERKAAVFDNHRTQFKDRPFFQSLLRMRGGKEYFHLAADVRGRPARELTFLR